MRINKKILMLCAFGVGLLLFLASSEQLAGWQESWQGGWRGDGTPPYTIAEGTVKGGVYVEGGHGYSREDPYVEAFELPEGEVKYARVYIPIWNYDGGDSIRVFVNGEEIAERQEPDYLSAWGLGLYCLEAGSFLHSGKNEVSVRSQNPGGGPYGITLAAVYRNESMPPVRFWINEGNYALAYTNKKDSVSSSFKGTLPDRPASLQVLLAAGTKGETDFLYFDSELVGTDVGRSADGRYFDLYRTEVIPESRESTLRFERGDEGYLHPCVAVLVGGTESDSDPEFLEVHEQRASEGNRIPVPVILVTLLACLALLYRYGKR
ncbi:MAG: DUF3344 domain-containing protein [Methanosarcinaceae archaeon]|nr:DUF3344 domain-containing protein [Methanosarcinaceae archaeon]MDD4498118.1 DUF3344 domain-containing protein [Methanosarcinaceae archaeon]